MAAAVLLRAVECAVKRQAIPLEASLDVMGAAGLDSLDLLERELTAGRHSAARALLSKSANHAAPGPRHLNIVGLLAMLEGRRSEAVASLLRAIEQPFGRAHLAAHKNLYWAVYLDAESSRNNDRLDEAWNGVIGAFERSRELAAPPHGISVFDVGIQWRICNHPMYDRNRRDRAWQSEADRWRAEYFELFKKAITNYLHRDLREEFRDAGQAAASICTADPERCESDWQLGQAAGRLDGPYAQKRLGGLVHIELLIADVLEKGVDGDLIEAGCYTGATAVFMRALLEQEGDGRPRRRKLFVADSFEGIPLPRTAREPACGLSVDGPDVAHGSANWPERYVAGQAQVRSTFRRYGLLDERVVFVPGFFNVSLPAAPIAQLALIHIDADAYESVLDALRPLYPRLAPGGHVVIDDFHLPAVRAAVHEYRAEHGVHERLLPVPTDYVTTCSPERAGPAHPLTDFLVEPLTVVFWTKAGSGPDR